MLGPHMWLDYNSNHPKLGLGTQAWRTLVLGNCCFRHHTYNCSLRCRARLTMKQKRDSSGDSILSVCFIKNHLPSRMWVGMWDLFDVPLMQKNKNKKLLSLWWREKIDLFFIWWILKVSAQGRIPPLDLNVLCVSIWAWADSHVRKLTNKKLLIWETKKERQKDRKYFTDQIP